MKRGSSLEEAKSRISEIQKKNSSKQIGKNKFSKEDRTRLSLIHKKRFTLEYYIEKYGQIDGPIKYTEMKSKQKQQGKISSEKRKQLGSNYRESSIRCKEYWMKRGFSENILCRVS